jgi:hypothetical protein
MGRILIGRCLNLLLEVLLAGLGAQDVAGAAVGVVAQRLQTGARTLHHCFGRQAVLAEGARATFAAAGRGIDRDKGRDKGRGEM